MNRLYRGELLGVVSASLAVFALTGLRLGACNAADQTGAPETHRAAGARRYGEHV